MKYMLALLPLVTALPAAAQVTCKENIMTSTHYCSSKIERSGGNFYFFATNDTGTEPNVIFSFGGLVSPARPDGVMVKLDGGTPFKARATAIRPDVNCRGYGGCRWSVGAAAEFTNEQFNQIGSATKMLISFTQGEYVSEPIEVDPKKIGSWFQEWVLLTRSTTPPATPSTPEN
jgi:hypothetical protein